MNFPVCTYGIDKVEFVSTRDFIWYKILFQNLKIYESKFLLIKAKPISNKKIKDSYKDSLAFEKGYKTKIIISKISEKTFPFLLEKGVDLGTIWALEIFKNIICDDENKAKELTNLLISKMFLLSQGRFYHLFIRDNLTTHTKKELKFKTEDKFNNYLYSSYARLKKKRTIGDRTLYLGDKDFIHATYARKAKSDSVPVVHQEFRLMGRNIQRLANVKKGRTHYLESLKNLQSFHAPSVYEKIAEKRIKYGEINKLKLARFLLGYPNKKKFTSDEIRDIELYLAHLKRGYNLNITADFIDYFKKHQIKKRLFVEPLSLNSLYRVVT